MENEHIQALFEGQELSEEFKTKATSIVEGMLSEKEKEMRQVIEEEQKEVLESKLQELESLSESYIQDEVLPTVNKYLTAAVNEWLEENKVAVQESAKVDLADSFLKGFVGLAESHNLQVPEGSSTVVENLESKVNALTEKLDAQIERNISLRETNDTLVKAQVLESVCGDLTESQKEKITPALGKLSFKDKDQFAGAVKDIVESYFPTSDKGGEPLTEESSVATTQEELTEQSGFLGDLLKRL